MPHLPGSGDTPIGSRGEVHLSGCAQQRPLETAPGRRGRTQHRSSAAYFTHHPKRPKPPLAPPSQPLRLHPTRPPPPGRLLSHRSDPPKSSSNPSRLAVRRLVPAELASFLIFPYHGSPRLPPNPIALALILASTRFRVSARRVSCCKWRRQARGSNCIICKKIPLQA
ncbi:unnamed protein product [Alopecurus aequalis]